VENVKIVKKADGVYLSIGQLSPTQQVSRKDIVALIDAYNVQNVDFITLSEKLQGDVSNQEIKISSSTQIFQLPETAEIDISSDRMEAFITFREPVNDGERLDTDGIIKIMQEAGIVKFSREAVNTLALHRVFGRRYSVAKGKPPINGADGYLQYHFNNENLRPKPKILEDGSVDFKQLGIMRLCERGDVLVTSVPPQPGRDGVDVVGNVIPFLEGRVPQPIPMGKNTYISEDGLHLIADVSGQLLIQQGKIHVNPCLEIKGDVDNSTGNINFNGQIIIEGNVLTGFEVRGTGNIEIHGVCEGATITTDADIVIGRGAQGLEKAVLRAGGNITAKFIEACTVSADGNIAADSILNSKVDCDGEVILEGKRGLLTGGKMIVGSKLVARTIGSPMGTTTTIEVGNNPKAILNLKEFNDEYNKMREEFEKIDKAVNLLTAQRRKGVLPDDKKTLLMKMLNVKMTYREKLNTLQLKIEELNQQLKSNRGTISASNVIQPGVHVTIGNANMFIRDKMSNCTLRNNGERVSIGPFAG